jgi:hypothetical protein
MTNPPTMGGARDPVADPARFDLADADRRLHAVMLAATRTN